MMLRTICVAGAFLATMASQSNDTMASQSNDTMVCDEESFSADVCGEMLEAGVEVPSLLVTLDNLAVTDDNLALAIDLVYYLLCASMVFMMQLGFAMLEVGCVGQKNIKNIILKGTLDICVSGMSFWAIGFAFAFGGDNKFIGGEEYFFGNCLDNAADCGDWGATYHEWFFQFAFAATAATIVSGAVAERCTLVCYGIYSFVLTAFIYPVVVHWQWGGGYTAQAGAVDYAGSAVVHMTGGLSAIIGAAVIGAREGRFSGPRFNVTVHEKETYSVVFQTLGTLVLWFGWFGFNTGSTLGISWVGENGATVPGSEAGLVMINTTLGPCAGGISAMLCTALMAYRQGHGFKLTLEPVLNGILSGLVSITAGCGDIRPWSAVVLGLVAGVLYVLTSHLQQQLLIDDVVDAGPVHFWCGILGVIGLGLFADNEGTGLTSVESGSKGLFYGHGKLLGNNAVLVFSVIVWVGTLMSALFLMLNALGLARVSSSVESAGMDFTEHTIGASSPIVAQSKSKVSAVGEEESAAHL